MPDFSTFKWLGFSGQGHLPNIAFGEFTHKQQLAMAA